MRLSSDYLADQGLQLPVAVLAERLTLAGLEVDSIEPVAPPFSGVVVAEVLTLEKHPDADKLRVATVNKGDEVLQIVCGAPNVAVGVKVPLATIGAQLPGGLQIKKGKLRGVESFGMLCSARELGLSEEASGLLILPDEAPVGTDIRSYLRLDDSILDINITPNRGDCFSLRGLLREIQLNCADRLPTNWSPAATPVPAVPGADPAPALVPPAGEALRACPAYRLRALRGLNNRVPTPEPIRRRLERAGLRCHDPIVDITNFVMLELGTPLHAFDRAKTRGALTVRFGRPDERLTLLNGEEALLDGEVLLIADEVGPLALAGVMGGAASACTADTTEILLESAWFQPLAIAGRARRYNLSSDAAQRFERGVDFTLQARALEQATALILEVCGGTASAVGFVGDEALLPARPPVLLPLAAVAQRLGHSYSPERITAILRALGCEVEFAAERFRVTPPSWRFDLEIPADLIEEIARVDGYGHIPATPQSFHYQPVAPGNQRLAADRLVALGYQEAICYSFLDPQWQGAFLPGAAAIDLQNPLSSTLSQLRLSLVPGLVAAVQYNRNRQQSDIRLFELGRVFNSIADQPYQLAGVLAGAAVPENWGDPNRPVDFYDAKATVEALLYPRVAEFTPGGAPYHHPNRSATVWLDGQPIGSLGALHPELLQRLGLKGGDLYSFELAAAALPTAHRVAYEALPRFPGVRRDLALLVDKNISAGALIAAIRQRLGALLQDCYCFDVYDSEALGGRRSLALALLLQDKEKTLQDEELSTIIVALVQHLKDLFDADLR